MDSEKFIHLKNSSNNNNLVISDKNLKAEEAKEDDGDQNEALFDSLIEQIGNDGKFQNRINYLYNLVFVMLITMPYSNYILAMTVPDHWCYVPGRESTNYTVEEWKDKWLPKETGIESGNEEHSSCEMYSFNITGEGNVTNCKYGWDYDRQWFRQTIPAQENWVCDRAWFATNSFTAGSIGEIIGTFIFGQLGDLWGRRPVFYLSLTVIIIARLLLVCTAHNYSLFMTVMAIGCGVTISVYQSPLVISMEVSPDSRKDHIAFIQCLGWVTGMCALPMIAWIVNDWSSFMVVTTLPCATYFFLYKLMPESPRWLASKGRVYEATKVLQYVAKVNDTTIPDNTFEVLQKIAAKKEKFKGVATLFNHWRLGKNTAIIVTLYVINWLSDYAILLNATNLAGNPFMNFFWQAIAELPGYIIARMLGRVFGRRWTLIGAYLLVSVNCAILISVYHLRNVVLQTILVAVIKFCVTCSVYMVWLQSLGIFPTCVRQTGISFSATIASVLCISGPYIVYSGTNVDPRLPYVVILCMAVVGFISGAFLPETLNQKLPETLEEAYVFGKDQKFWSFAIHKKKEKMESTQL